MRIDAMRESLERIGRFDPRRARDRFLSSFDPAFCKFILVNRFTVGFVLAKPADEYLTLLNTYMYYQSIKEGESARPYSPRSLPTPIHDRFQSRSVRYATVNQTAFISGTVS
jgi:hypothetical protein